MPGRSCTAGPPSAAKLSFFLLLTAAIAGCGSTERAPGAEPAAAPSATSPAPADSPSRGDAGPASNACVAGEALCLAKDRARACVASGGTGAHWVEETCAAGSGCFQGKCAAARCSDECTLGEKQSGKTCAPCRPS